MSCPHSPASDAINEYYNGYPAAEWKVPDEPFMVERGGYVAERVETGSLLEFSLILGDMMQEHVPDWVWNILHAYVTREPLDFEGRVVPLPVQEYLIAHYLSDIGVGN